MLIYVGMPSIDGKIHAATMDSLLAEHFPAREEGVHFYIDWECGNSLIHVARNRIASRFLETEWADVLVFIDSDISWNRGDLIKLAKRPEGVIAGSYRIKSHDEVRFHVRPPVTWENDVLRVDGVPTGFLKISKEALRQLPAEPYRHGKDETHYNFFPTGVWEGDIWGEDYGFCRFCNLNGVPLYLDPSIRLRHHDGLQKFEGNVLEWLKSLSDAADAEKNSSPSPDEKLGTT